MDVLSRVPHDFYALPCFTALDASWGGGTAVAYHDAEEDVLIPLVLHAFPDGVAEAVSPYGYPGIVANGPSEAVRAAIERYLRAGQDAGIVTSFVRLHPLLNADIPEALQSLDACTVVEHGPTVSVSLAEDDAAWLSGLSKGLRRDIRVLDREGYTVEFDAPDALDAFLACYHASMDRLDAADMYLFDRDYVERLLDCLGEAITVCVVKSGEGEPACAGLFTCVDGLAQYHLSGTNPDHFSLGPNKLMIVAARTWARERGGRTFHLGGGVGGREDGLFKFKQRFGHRLTPFRTMRLIHDRARYDTLHQDWLDRNELAEAPDPRFFPVYRQSV